MPHHCLRCQRPVSASAIDCPYCQAPLKALGHQGIPLHQASGDAVLCDTCTYHQDDSCTYPNRPVAKDCIMYVDMRVPQDPDPITPDRSFSLWDRLTQWANQNLVLLMVVGLFFLSLLLVLSGR